jgi:cell division protein ZapA
MPQKVKVEIFGQTYYVAGDLDEAYVANLARHVDSTMRAVAQATQIVDTTKVAVLAALAIADELHSAKPAAGEPDPDLRERAERCLLLVEQALKQTA